MNPFITTSAIFFFGYVIFVIIKVGMLKSISNSYYALNNTLFTIFGILVGSPLLIAPAFLNDGLNEPRSALIAGLGIGMWFIGVTPQTQEDKLTRHLHNTFSGITILIGFAAIWMYYNSFDNFVIFVALSIIILLFRWKTLLLIEIVGALCIYEKLIWLK